MKFFHHLDTHSPPKYAKYEHPIPTGLAVIEDYRFASYVLYYYNHFFKSLSISDLDILAREFLSWYALVHGEGYTSRIGHLQQHVVVF